jgi:2,4-dienoyl-CoA reductase-like NADH-dependent reductase (Old Yellow Enzyme family)
MYIPIHDQLFSSTHLAALTLKNRIVFPAIGTHFANPDGTVSRKQIDFYAKRAEGDVGLIVVEFSAVDPVQKGSTRETGIWADRFIEGLSALTSTVKSFGAKIAIQLHHPGRMGDSRINGIPGVAPSAVPSAIIREVPRELSVSEIDGVIEEFVQGARRAKEAGFDAVELHGASGYLIYQFFSPLANLRQDEWGGDTRRRTRFAREIVRRTKALLGKEYPVILRMAVTDYQEGGITLEESMKIVRIMEKEGIDSISVTAGTFDSPIPGLVPPMVMARGCHAGLSAEIKKVTRVPVMVAGRINGLKLANQILAEGKADLICMGRAFIADPHLLWKEREGRHRDVKVCFADNTCVHSITRGIPGSPLVCLMNPEVGREGEQEPKTERPRNILIVGGNPAGFEAARVAALQGHRVTLWDESERLGKHWSYRITPLISGRLSLLESLHVQVEIGKEITPLSVQELSPDLVLWTKSLKPGEALIPGPDRVKTVQADLVLEGKVQVRGKVVVIGGGNIGIELAEHLMKEAGVFITIVEEKWMGYGIERFSRIAIIGRLRRHGVQILEGAKPIRIEGDGLTIKRKNGSEERIKADSVLIALPEVILDQIPEWLAQGPWKVLALNPCRSPSEYVEASEEGAEVIRKLIH